MEISDREIRVGVLSVPINAVRWFYALFSVGTIYLTVTNTLTVATRVNASGWQEIQDIATAELAQAGGASIIGSAILVEVGRMVLAAIWEERTRRKALAEGREEGIEEGLEKGREEGRAEGREEGRGEGREEGHRENQALWLAWNRRRLEAEEKGEVFHEPPPDFSNNHNGGSR